MCCSPLSLVRRRLSSERLRILGQLTDADCQPGPSSRVTDAWAFVTIKTDAKSFRGFLLFFSSFSSPVSSRDDRPSFFIPSAYSGSSSSSSFLFHPHCLRLFRLLFFFFIFLFFFFLTVFLRFTLFFFSFSWSPSFSSSSSSLSSPSCSSYLFFFFLHYIRLFLISSSSSSCSSSSSSRLLEDITATWRNVPRQLFNLNRHYYHLSPLLLLLLLHRVSRKEAASAEAPCRVNYDTGA